MNRSNSDEVKKMKSNLDRRRRQMKQKFEKEQARQNQAFKHPEMARDDELEQTFEAWQAEAQARLEEGFASVQEEVSTLERPGGAPPAQLAKRRLKALSPIERRRLGQLDSDIRHSVVEACFYNLKLLAQMLPEKHAQPGFAERFLSLTKEMPSVEKRLVEYLGTEVADTTIGALFPEVRTKVLDLVNAIAAHIPAPEDLKQAEKAKEVGEKLPNLIDQLMSELLKIKLALEEIKVAPWNILEQALAIQEQALKDARVELRLSSSPEAKSLRLHADSQGLQDVFVEFLRNCVDHAFPEGLSEPRILEIKASGSKQSGQSWEVELTDNGCGALSDKDEKPGHGGRGLTMVREIIEKQHGGTFVGNFNIEGTSVKIGLPMQ